MKNSTVGLEDEVEEISHKVGQNDEDKKGYINLGIQEVQNLNRAIPEVENEKIEKKIITEIIRVFPKAEGNISKLKGSSKGSRKMHEN